MFNMEINEHLRDKRISFDEPTHKYTIDGISDYVSVTTLIHKFFPHFNSDLIISKMMKSKKWHESKYYGKTKQEIKDEWEQSGKQSAQLGTDMHNQIETFFKENKKPEGSKELEYFNFFWEESKNSLKPYRAEWRIFDEDAKIAGSIDMIFTDENNNLIIYDWKRSKEIKTENSYESGYAPVDHLPNCNFWHYSLQLNIYKKILQEKYGFKVVGMFLLILYPGNDGPLKYEVPDLTEEVDNIWKTRK